jgi:hypothetical protein
MDMNKNIDWSQIPNRASHGWHQIPARAVDRYFMGVDIGQSSDPTAICVLQHRIIPLDTWTPNRKAEHWKQDRQQFFDVRHLERLPIGRPYPEYVQNVAERLTRPPLDKGCTLAADQTGVGAAVLDLFEAAGLQPNRITITAGLETTQHGGRHFHVPKAVLITNMEAKSHSGELRVAAETNDAEALREELKDFRRLVSSAGRPSWNARDGKHDDLILSVAIALWISENRPYTGSEPLPF